MKKEINLNDHLEKGEHPIYDKLDISYSEGFYGDEKVYTSYKTAYKGNDGMVALNDKYRKIEIHQDIPSPIKGYWGAEIYLEMTPQFSYPLHHVTAEEVLSLVVKENSYKNDYLHFLMQKFHFVRGYKICAKLRLENYIQDSNLLDFPNGKHYISIFSLARPTTLATGLQTLIIENMSISQGYNISSEKPKYGLSLETKEIA